MALLVFNCNFLFLKVKLKLFFIIYKIIFDCYVKHVRRRKKKVSEIIFNDHFYLLINMDSFQTTRKYKCYGIRRRKSKHKFSSFEKKDLIINQIKSREYKLKLFSFFFLIFFSDNEYCLLLLLFEKRLVFYFLQVLINKIICNKS